MSTYFESECKLIDWGETSKEGTYIQIGAPWRDHELMTLRLAEEKTLIVELSIFHSHTSEVVYNGQAWIYKVGSATAPWLKIRVDDLDRFKGLEGLYFDVICSEIREQAA